MTTDVNLRIRLTDGASRPLGELERKAREIQQRMLAESRRVAEEAARASQQSNERIRSGFSQLEQQTRTIQQRMAADARRTAEEQTRAARQTQDAHIRAYQQINEARERLSVRSHAQIREDIAHTQTAYRTLATSGILSFREQQQAAEHMRTTVRNLTNEMGHLTTAQRAYGAIHTGASFAGGAVGAAGGFAYGVKGPIKDTLDLDRRINNLAVTAYPERDINGKKIGAKELENAIHHAVDVSGGNVDGVTNLLGEMIAGGKLPKSDILKALPYLAKTAVANDANPQDVGRLANTLYGQGLVTNIKELERANNAIIAIGQKSSFEYKNQVMHLPNQLPYARTAGASGLMAVRDVAVMNATSSVVMGTADEAAVATHNALMKMSSQDTAKDYKKNTGRDLHKDLMNARLKGISPFEFWQHVIEAEIDQNPDLKAYKKKLDNAKSPEEGRQILADIEMIGRGSAISKYFQEMRGQTGILGYQNAAYRTMLQNEATRAINGEFQPNENNFSFISQTDPHKVDVVKNTYEQQRKHLIDKATPSIGNAAEQANSWAKDHPDISQYMPAIPWVMDGITGSILGQAATAGVAGWMLRGAFQGGGAAISGIAATSRASLLFSQLSAGTAALLTRLGPAVTGISSLSGEAAAAFPALAAAGARYAAPVAGAGITGYEVGNFLNLSGELDQAISILSGKTNTLGGYIYELTNPKPVEVNTTAQLTVTLSPGLIPVGKATASSSSAPGSNKSAINTGNIWQDAP